MMKTKSGGHVVFDITSFLPGRLIPEDYFPPRGICNGPWYFMPSDWEAPDWGGVWVAHHRQFPMCYSPGFETEEEALSAAEEWEKTKAERDAQASAFAQFINEGPSVRL